MLEEAVLLAIGLLVFVAAAGRLLFGRPGRPGDIQGRGTGAYSGQTPSLDSQLCIAGIGISSTLFVALVALLSALLFFGVLEFFPGAFWPALLVAAAAALLAAMALSDYTAWRARPSDCLKHTPCR